MSLLGRILERVTRRPRLSANPFARGYDIAAELPFLQEQIKAFSGPGVTRRGVWDDNFAGETANMREGYRRLFFAEPSVKAALLGKIAAVQSLPIHVKPAGETPLDQTVADFTSDVLNGCHGGSSSLVWSILSGGLVDGFSVSEPVWGRFDRGRWKGRHRFLKLKSKDTRYIQYDLDEFKNVVAVISTKAGGIQRHEPTDFVLFSYMPLFNSPFGVSDLRAAYRAGEMIVALCKIRMVFLDKLAGPYIVAKTADSARRDALLAAIKQARGQGAIVLDPSDEIEVMDLASAGTDQFQRAIEDLRKEAAIGITGAFLQMLTGGAGEQRGSAVVQQDTADLFIWLLAVSVAACLNEQLVRDIVEPNFGSTVGLPAVHLEAPNPEHVVADLQIDETLHAIGLPLSRADLYERSGRRPPKNAGDVLSPTAAAPPGLPGLPPQLRIGPGALGTLGE